MKSINFFKSLLLSVVCCLGFQSCIGDSDDEPTDPSYFIAFQDMQFNSQNYWADCYNVATGNINKDGFSFSHQASAFEYDGVTYTSWKGFCPSKVNDNSDYNGDWTDHQWGCIAQNPAGAVFLVANSGAEVSENVLENDVCSVEMVSGSYFKPKYVWVTNSSYTYYCAKNGSAFNEPFTLDDNYILNVVGVRNGVATVHLKYALIANGMFLTEWAAISLEPLGTVDKVLFYTTSTCTGSYGLNIPAYFCLADFSYSPSILN